MMTVRILLCVFFLFLLSLELKKAFEDRSEHAFWGWMAASTLSIVHLINFVDRMEL